VAKLVILKFPLSTILQSLNCHLPYKLLQITVDLAACNAAIDWRCIDELHNKIEILQQYQSKFYDPEKNYILVAVDTLTGLLINGFYWLVNHSSTLPCYFTMMMSTYRGKAGWHTLQFTSMQIFLQETMVTISFIMFMLRDVMTTTITAKSKTIVTTMITSIFMPLSTI
jgi:hypothetical protein